MPSIWRERRRAEAWRRLRQDEELLRRGVGGRWGSATTPIRLLGDALEGRRDVPGRRAERRKGDRYDRNDDRERRSQQHGGGSEDRRDRNRGERTVGRRDRDRGERPGERERDVDYRHVQISNVLRCLEQTSNAFEISDVALSHAGCAASVPPTHNYDFKTRSALPRPLREARWDAGRRLSVFLVDEGADLPALPTEALAPSEVGLRDAGRRVVVVQANKGVTFRGPPADTSRVGKPSMSALRAKPTTETRLWAAPRRRTHRMARRRRPRPRQQSRRVERGARVRPADVLWDCRRAHVLTKRLLHAVANPQLVREAPTVTDSEHCRPSDAFFS